jgi:putative membrane protein
MLLMIRAALGGILMGLANLVPGISGGTMLLAAGIYPDFIESIAEVTRLRFRARSLLVLGCVVGAAAVAILLLAGTVKALVVDHRWIMYSLFIGLTLGGLPIVWRMIGKHSRAVWIGAAAGFLGMALLAWAQQSNAGTSGSGAGSMVMLALAGVAGASAMILPGVSGGYLLLVLGQYVPILSAIDAFKSALEAGQVGDAVGIALKVGIPVGLGVVVGIVGVSNLLGVLLKRHKQATLGVLLGLLVGAIVGLWPFQEGVRPRVGDTVKGQVLTEETLPEVDPEDYPTGFFKPAPGQVFGALGLVLAGFAATYAIARLGGKDEEDGQARTAAS